LDDSLCGSIEVLYPAELFREEKEYHYIGNATSIVELYSGECLLLFPSGSKLNKLNLLSLDPGMMAEDLLLSSATKSFQVFSDLKSRIFQVETTARDTCAFAALRSSSAYSIIRIQSHEATPSGTFSPYIVDIINQFCFRNSLCDLSFNRCIDGFPKQLQCLSITDDGILYSWEMNDR